MDMTEFLPVENEKPLDRLPVDGGFTSIFRTIACVGDSLSSGEFEGLDEDGKKSFHDMFDYSWGQFMARAAGIKVYNFSRGGMTAKAYMQSFAEQKGYWDPELKAQAYILALGVNDVKVSNAEFLGSVEDICLEDYTKNADSFAGYYAQIIQRYKQIQPNARFFLVTKLRTGNSESDELSGKFRDLLYEIAKLFDNTYVIDLYTYAPVYDGEFRKNFFLAGHMNPCGYKLTARMIMAYIDYIVRHNMQDFKQIGFIGTPFYNCKEKL